VVGVYGSFNLKIEEACESIPDYLEMRGTPSFDPKLLHGDFESWERDGFDVGFELTDETHAMLLLFVSSSDGELQKIQR
jgi:hypothetical protein